MSMWLLLWRHDPRNTYRLAKICFWICLISQTHFTLNFETNPYCEIVCANLKLDMILDFFGSFNIVQYVAWSIYITRIEDMLQKLWCKKALNHSNSSSSSKTKSHRIHDLICFEYNLALYWLYLVGEESNSNRRS